MKNTQNLQNLIASSYNGGLKFGVNTGDIEQAVKALIEANAQGVGFKQFIELHKSYLSNKGLSLNDIDNEIAKVSNLRSYLLND